MEGSAGQEGGGRGQDTVCLLLQQPARLALAAQRLLGHHEQKVGVGQSLRVEQPGGTTGARGLEVRSTPEPRPRPLKRPRPDHARSPALQVPAAVSAVDDGIIGRVHRAEVVLGLFHDAAALARLRAALGFCRVCGAQTPQPRPQTLTRCPPQLGSALSPALPVKWPLLPPRMWI